MLHGDVLDPWSWIAERRVALAAEPFDGRFAPIEHSPFPRRWEVRAPSTAERRARARAVVRAAREKDAPALSPELWVSSSPPTSSAPPLLALAAARLQGAAKEAALRAALREAALVRGLDVSRADVIAEVASRTTGLDLSRFLSALRAPATERSVRAAFNAALDRGVETAPSLVIGEEWLIPGPRTTDEYREILQRFLARSVGVPLERIVH
ncbi:MAG TPA: DsbA family protein [Anaeromyxobacteraceae bacterium]|nr:DsbA family protein [Anaeromyxobacteraceae bacterium]